MEGGEDLGGPPRPEGARVKECDVDDTRTLGRPGCLSHPCSPRTLSARPKRSIAHCQHTAPRSLGGEVLRTDGGSAEPAPLARHARRVRGRGALRPAGGARGAQGEQPPDARDRRPLLRAPDLRRPRARGARAAGVHHGRPRTPLVAVRCRGRTRRVREREASAATRTRASLVVAQERPARAADRVVQRVQQHHLLVGARLRPPRGAGGWWWRWGAKGGEQAVERL